jgi:hypothetical protein
MPVQLWLQQRQQQQQHLTLVEGFTCPKISQMFELCCNKLGLHSPLLLTHIAPPPFSTPAVTPSPAPPRPPPSQACQQCEKSLLE